MTRLLLIATLAGCLGEDPSAEPTAPNQLRGDDKADGGAPLWAGLTSITFERYAPDPCDNGQHVLGDDPAVYDEWVRERAGIRNICFEVWSPGVTDWDNPDFWKQLDVEVHWRFGDGAFQHAYVDSIDRRGNNRRYAWSIDFSLDPFVFATSVPSIKVPFRIASETDTSASVEADLQVYFTVNGRVLNAPSNQPFTVRYQGYARKPTLAASNTGYVLHDIVTCDNGNVRFGSGAGFFAADIRTPALVDALGGGLDGSLIYGVPTAKGSGIVSMTYGSQTTITGQALPGFSDSGGLTIVPDGNAMTLSLAVYDRAVGRVRQLTATATGCTAP